MFHLAAYYQSVNPGGVLVAIAAVQDPVITTQGNDVRVPTGYNNLIGTYGFIADASGARVQLDSPSLRAMFNPDIEPIELDVTPSGAAGTFFYEGQSFALAPNESLDFFVQSAPAGAVAHYGLIALADGPNKPVSGAIYPIRFTSAIQQMVGGWVNGNITFDQVLPAGSYQVVGMRVRGVGLVAARLVFVGGILRPGVPAVQAINNEDWGNTRWGQIGVLGQFDNTTPPTLDVLGGTAAAQTGVLDLIKVK